MDILWRSCGDLLDMCSTPVAMRPSEDHDLMVNRGPFSVRVTSLASKIHKDIEKMMENNHVQWENHIFF